MLGTFLIEVSSQVSNILSELGGLLNGTL